MIGLIPPIVDIKTVGADLQSDSATSAQSQGLWDDRRSDVPVACSRGGVLIRRGLELRHHSGPEFWFCWYMEALSFSRARHRWQLQLPVKKETDNMMSSPWPQHTSSQLFRSSDFWDEFIPESRQMWLRNLHQRFQHSDEIPPDNGDKEFCQWRQLLIDWRSSWHLETWTHYKALTYPPEAQSWEDLDSTCDNLGHSHHRTAAGPTETQHGQSADLRGKNAKRSHSHRTMHGLGLGWSLNSDQKQTITGRQLTNRDL